MTTTRHKRRSNLFDWKKIAPALLLLGLLGYLGATNLLGGSGDSGAIVQEAEALVIEDALLTQGSPSEAENPFFTILDSGPIPNPASVVPEIASSSDEQPAGPGTDPAGEPIAGSIAVAAQPPPEPDESGNAAPEAEPLTLIPTYGWVNAFSAASVLNGEPVPVGSIVTAYDPDGVLIGRSSVTTPGEYGAMPLYMDDPSTLIDEGAIPGDLITFRVNGFDTVVLGPNSPVWTENGGVLVLNLASSDSPAQQ